MDGTDCRDDDIVVTKNEPLIGVRPSCKLKTEWQVRQVAKLMCLLHRFLAVARQILVS